jgi:hypothetical protein
MEHRYTSDQYSIEYQIAAPGWHGVMLRADPKWGGSEMIRGVKIVSLPVRNQDVALKFYTEKVGFKVATDQPFGPGQRWIELLIPGADTTLALFTPPARKTGLAASNRSRSGATTFLRQRRSSNPKGWN